MVRRVVLYRGQVQGVGFRAQCLRISRNHPAVNGTVRNLANGSVELIVEGNEKEVDAYLGDVAYLFAGYITDIHLTTEMPQGLSGFTILR